MIISLWGIEGSGKSSVGLSFPKPLFHMDLDLGGFDRAIWRVANEVAKTGKSLRCLKLGSKPSEDLISACVTYEPDIKLSEVDWNEWDIVSKPYIAPIQEEKLLGIQGGPGQKNISIRFPRQVIGIKETWQEAVIDIVTVCKNPPVKTVMTDSATQLWGVCHSGFLQEKQEIQISQGIKPEHKDFREKLLPVEFPNNRMRDLIYTVRSFGKNLVMTHYPKDIYADRLNGERLESYRTGEVEPDGFKHTVTLDDIVLWCFVETDKRREIVKGVENPSYGELLPHARVSLKCGLSGMGMTAVGRELPSPSYAGLMELQSMMKGGQG